MLSCLRFLAALASAVILAACAGGPAVPPGASCEVTSARAPFYKYGPAQTFGADDMLTAGTRVTLIQRTMGFSRVMLATGMTGYVSNDDISPAAPEQLPKPGSVVTNRKLDPLFTAPSKPGKTKHSNVQGTPGDPLFDVNDVPLPMKDEPKPEMRASPPETRK
jgi:hypothetical protein